MRYIEPSVVEKTVVAAGTISNWRSLHFLQLGSRHFYPDMCFPVAIPRASHRSTTSLYRQSVQLRRAKTVAVLHFTITDDTIEFSS